MGAAACGGKGSKGRAAVNGDWPIGATSCKPKHTKVSCQPPPPPQMHAVPQEHEIRRMRILEGVDENATFYKRGQKAFSWGPPIEEKNQSQRSKCAAHPAGHQTGRSTRLPANY